MGAPTLTLGFDGRERIGGTLLVSVLLHSALFLAAFAYTKLGVRFGMGWGKNWGGGGAVRVGAVASLPGVPLPTPMLATRNILATQNPGLYQTEPTPPPPPEEKAQDIPKFKEATPPEKAIRKAKRLQKEELTPPENAVPFGLGGKPTMSYAPVVNAAGEGGLNFGGGGDFGERYSWYVAAVRNRVSSNWLLTTISPQIQSAPRVYLSFTILRDGTVTNIQVTQSSGIAEVDRSALRAILASSPLTPLPRDYTGNQVSVEFYFDFRRR